MAKQTSGGGAGVVVMLVFLVWLASMIPKEIWILLAVLAGVAVVVGIVMVTRETIEQCRADELEQQRKRDLAEAEAARQRRIVAVGEKNAERIEATERAVARIAGSEAARDGWLGEIDFTADTASITDNLTQAYALRAVVGELSSLPRRTADDNTILADAQRVVAKLETAASERMELIGKCATEAAGIDKSLRQEREDAKTAEQRAALHARLGAMLYGIAATPDLGVRSSGVDPVLARVAAFREITALIQLARAKD